MVEVAVADIYSFAFEPHDDGLLEDTIVKLCSIPNKVAKFREAIARLASMVFIRWISHTETMPNHSTVWRLTEKSIT